MSEKLDVVGIGNAMVDAIIPSTQVEIEARNYFKDKVYTTVIPRNVRLSEAPSHGIPVLIYDKLCAGSKSYINFTNEFLKQENIMESAA